MPTSSLNKTFVVSGRSSVRSFVSAVSKSIKSNSKSRHLAKTHFVFVSDEKSIREFLKSR